MLDSIGNRKGFAWESKAQNVSIRAKGLFFLPVKAKSQQLKG
ncbi:hypothetical protein D515_04685 [Grimontia indica]|uniref:Uncharacterized protein n=1 Tax=Grimontia indica TaxID=1056512 RepID=R1I8S0_9GAMM|nr:hypothetical protein D515_04685 [Grimontia indica]